MISYVFKDFFNDRESNGDFSSVDELWDGVHAYLDTLDCYNDDLADAIKRRENRIELYEFTTSFDEPTERIIIDTIYLTPNNINVYDVNTDELLYGNSLEDAVILSDCSKVMTYIGICEPLDILKCADSYGQIVSDINKAISDIRKTQSAINRGLSEMRKLLGDAGVIEQDDKASGRYIINIYRLDEYLNGNRCVYKNMAFFTKKEIIFDTKKE